MVIENGGMLVCKTKQLVLAGGGKVNMKAKLFPFYLIFPENIILPGRKCSDHNHESINSCGPYMYTLLAASIHVQTKQAFCCMSF